MGVMWSVFLHFVTVLGAEFFAACKHLTCVLDCYLFFYSSPFQEVDGISEDDNYCSILCIHLLPYFYSSLSSRRLVASLKMKQPLFYTVHISGLLHTTKANVFHLLQGYATQVFIF